MSPDRERLLRLSLETGEAELARAGVACGLSLPIPDQVLAEFREGMGQIVAGLPEGEVALLSMATEEDLRAVFAEIARNTARRWTAS